MYKTWEYRRLIPLGRVPFVGRRAEIQIFVNVTVIVNILKDARLR
jgi:hypothetical protein